jgi:prepilin-type processing-associated H-X9-DG protein
VELLVVIAIISILAGMLLPALENAKELAYSVQCRNNLKQIGIPVQLYGDDNEGFNPGRGYFYPYSIPGKAGEVVWHEFYCLLGYMPESEWVLTKKGESVFVCPSWNDIIYSHYTTYGMTSWAQFLPAKYGSGKFYRSGSIPTCSNFPMIGDSIRISSSSSWNLAQVHSIDRKDYGASILQYTHLRHSDSANFIFADGHVSPNNIDALDTIGFGSTTFKAAISYSTDVITW